MKKICVITSTRADFGILKNLLIEIKKNNLFKLFLIAGGTHYSKLFGYTLKEINQSKLKVNHSIKFKNFTDNVENISKVFSLSLQKTCSILKKIKPDCLMVLGDRYEILSSTIAANLCKIPVIHLYGGEITEGALDDSFRHAITKLSHLHLVANKIYKKRVIQLGENKNNVHIVGGLVADNLSKNSFLKREELENKLKLKFKKRNYIVNFHPETVNNVSTKKQLVQILGAFKKIKSANFIFTNPGFDRESSIIIKEFKKQKNNKNFYFFKSLGQKNYFSLMKYCTSMIGNSSSGILEMPYFNKPTINLGTRQKGRVLSKLVINCPIKTKAILNSIKKVEKKTFLRNTKGITYPFGKVGAIKKIISILKKKKLKKLFIKKFIDL
jgi:GDP/UDP-N,N'-diacetylbacillosamine 2-epimerase (hydrolysing)